MRTTHAAAAAAALLAAAPARAQLSNQAIALESGISAGFGAGAGAHAPVAIAAARWLEGDVDAIVRVALGSARETAGRGAAAYARATAGLRWSLGADAVRPQLHLDVGARTARGEAPRYEAGAAAGIEVFVARDLGLSARAGARLPLGRGAPLFEALGGIWAYF